MTYKNIAAIKEAAAKLKGPPCAAYLLGVRDGLDVAAAIAQDRKFSLDKDERFEAIIDWLETDAPN